METPLCRDCPVLNFPGHLMVNTAIWDDFDRIKVRNSYQPRDIIFKRGDKADGFYCLSRGSARSFLKNSVHQHREQTLNIYREGDWMGFRDSIFAETYHHNAIAIEPLVVCFFSGKEVKDILQVNENFQYKVLQKFAQQSREMERKIFSLGTKDKHRRLAELILDLYQHSPHKPQIELNISRRVIASMIGTSQEFVFRALADFKDRQWLEIKPHQLKILKPKELQKLANLL